MIIGIFGGTFDPIHNGHVQIAESALPHVDRLIVTVAAVPPHKTAPSSVSDADRLYMAELAFEGMPKVEVSAMELERAGKSYTCDTVAALKTAYPNDRLALVMGGDMLLYFRNWYRFEYILATAALMVTPRPETDVGLTEEVERLRREFGADITVLPPDADPISSTDVRARLEAGLPTDGLVPPSVADYVYINGLYLPDDVRAAFERLRATVKPHRFRHTVGVMRTAAALAERYGADAEKTRWAALLHDCGKLKENRAAAYAALNIAPDEYERAMPAILHATAGRVIAEKVYGVTDTDVLDAIASHTIGRKNMTTLDKIIYVSDAMEPGRTYPGVETIREAAEKSLNGAVIAAMDISEHYCLRDGQPVHPVTTAERTRLKNEKEESC